LITASNQEYNCASGKAKYTSFCYFKGNTWWFIRLLKDLCDFGKSQIRNVLFGWDSSCTNTVKVIWQFSSFTVWFYPVPSCAWNNAWEGIWEETHNYTPAQQSCKGDILESACPSGCPAVSQFFSCPPYNLRILWPTVFNLAWRLVMIRRWPLLISRSPGQRSQGPWLQKACPSNNLRILWPTVFIFGMEVSHA
jgi:hypothetical protein